MTSKSEQKQRFSQNIRSVVRSIEEACQLSDRRFEDVTVVAVTKYVDRETTETFAESLDENRGLFGDDQLLPPLGESRPQVLQEKAAAWAGTPSCRWHMIGHLQTNKIKQVLPYATLIHSLDRFDLIKKVERFAIENQLTVHGLIQFNISQEENKGGFELDRWEEVFEFVQNLQAVEIQGVMGMAGLGVDSKTTEKQFASLQDTQKKLSTLQEKADMTSHQWREISCGMSADMDLAIKHGSTMVRIGSAFFEGVR